MVQILNALATDISPLASPRTYLPTVNLLFILRLKGFLLKSSLVMFLLYKKAVEAWSCSGYFVFLASWISTLKFLPYDFTVFHLNYLALSILLISRLGPNFPLALI